ncbi:hypothetical protein ACP275_02G099300 [Erythranthe tilingii]
MHLSMDTDLCTLIGVFFLFEIFASLFFYFNRHFRCCSCNYKSTPLLQSIDTGNHSDHMEDSNGSMIDVCMHCGHHWPKNELLCCATCHYTTMHPRCICGNQSNEFDVNFSDAWVCRECAINIATFYQLI